MHAWSDMLWFILVTTDQVCAICYLFALPPPSPQARGVPTQQEDARDRADERESLLLISFWSVWMIFESRPIEVEASAESSDHRKLLSIGIQEKMLEISD
jgi:hypothetical protein